LVKYGVSPWIWVSPASTESMIGLLPKIEALGFDGIEVPVEDPARLDAERLREALDSTGLGATVCGFFLPGRDPLKDGERKAAEEYARACIDTAVALQSDVVCGPLYSPVGKLVGRPSTDAEWRRVVVFLRSLGAYAGDRGVTLAIEPLNRYETYLVNTTRQCVRLVEEVGSPHVRIHLDTYHMNIEEKDFHGPIRAAGKLLHHMHCCESDRGVPGTGQVAWRDVLRALKEVGYDRWLVIESFILGVPVAAAAAIWRQIAPSGDALAGEGLRFLKSLWRIL